MLNNVNVQTTLFRETEVSKCFDIVNLGNVPFSRNTFKMVRKIPYERYRTVSDFEAPN